MSGFWRIAAALLAVAVAVGIGVAVYNAGASAGFAEAARQAAESGDVVAPYGPGWAGPYWYGGWGHGFGFFGIFFWILGFFLIIGLLRAAFGWGRWRGPGPGSGRGWGDRTERIEEWHRDLHRRESAEG